MTFPEGPFNVMPLFPIVIVNAPFGLTACLSPLPAGPVAPWSPFGPWMPWSPDALDALWARDAPRDRLVARLAGCAGRRLLVETAVPLLHAGVDRVVARCSVSGPGGPDGESSAGGEDTENVGDPLASMKSPHLHLSLCPFGP